MEIVNRSKYNLVHIGWLIYKPNSFFMKLEDFDLSALSVPLIYSIVIQLTNYSAGAGISFEMIFLLFGFGLLSNAIIALILKWAIKLDRTRTITLFISFLYIDVVMIIYQLLKLSFNGFSLLSEGGVEYSVLSFAFVLRKCGIDSPFLVGMLSVLDVFQLWRYYLMMMALALLGKLSYKKSSIIISIFFCISCLTMGLINYYGLVK